MELIYNVLIKNNILLIICAVLIFISYLLILIKKLSKQTCTTTGSDIAFKILNDYNDINLVESKDNYFNSYNMKRKMIHLTSKTYNSNTIFDNSIASLISSYSTLDSQFLSFLSKIFTNIRYISASPFISLLISIFINNKTDAKIGLIIIMIISIYLFMIQNINNASLFKLEEEKLVENNITKFLKSLLNINYLLFITTIIEVVRIIIILLS